MVGEVIGRAVGNLFLGGPANVSWERALEGLGAEDAMRVPAALPHSAAQIVAHVQFWQAWLLGVIAGNDPAPPEHASGGWPEPGEWEALRATFLRDSAALRERARDEGFVQTLDRQGRPHGVTLSNFAGHSIYHLGQVVSVRRALGLWPPPGGGDTW
ncbi:DinB family protein [Deinococcus koreensis]|uniref:DinB family protein n=1 Tax=Deinococcus koreensis TaxID=2054903 RepID=A0A2K3V0P3_9DEIO|nr:DinB family protein [Deinococcus koreensis]PNY82357.1 DinB family protein [Deinococcus koreensis]